MARFRNRLPVFFNMRTDRTVRFARLAREAAQGGSRNTNHGILEAMICWQSAIEAARRAGAISNSAARELNRAANYNEPEHFAPEDGSVTITTEDEWNAVPAGCFVALLGSGFSGGDERHLSHVMVSLGDGCAAGSNNGPVGGSATWEALDLNQQLEWRDGLAHREGRNFIVRIVDIESQDSPSCFLQ